MLTKTLNKKRRVVKREFSDLSVKEQRRRIVLDAIKQINTRKVKVKAGHYMSIIKGNLSEGEIDTHNFGEGLNLQTLLKEKKKPVCQVCAQGSLFAACVLNVNKVKTNENIQGHFFQEKKLRKWFSYLELCMIETAFEGVVIRDNMDTLGGEGSRYVGASKLGKKCITYGRKYSTPKKRLLAILKNILRNGKFKP